MNEHITVVYYDQDGHPSAFHVINADTEKLQLGFAEHDVATIKNITIESDKLAERRFRTLFMERDILDFLEHWNIVY